MPGSEAGYYRHEPRGIVGPKSDILHLGDPRLREDQRLSVADRYEQIKAAAIVCDALTLKELIADYEEALKQAAVHHTHRMGLLMHQIIGNARRIISDLKDFCLK